MDVIERVKAQREWKRNEKSLARNMMRTDRNLELVPGWPSSPWVPYSIGAKHQVCGFLSSVLEAAYGPDTRDWI